MKFSVKENNSSRKYTVVPEEGTANDWADIIDWYSYQNYSMNEFDAFGLIPSKDGIKPYFEVSEKEFPAFKEFAETTTMVNLRAFQEKLGR